MGIFNVRIHAVMRLLFAVFFFTRLVSRMLKRTHPYPLLLHIFVGVAVVTPPPTICIFTPLLCAACTYSHFKTRLLYPSGLSKTLFFATFFLVFPRVFDNALLFFCFLQMSSAVLSHRCCVILPFVFVGRFIWHPRRHSPHFR